MQSGPVPMSQAWLCTDSMLLRLLAALVLAPPKGVLTKTVKTLLGGPAGRPCFTAVAIDQLWHQKLQRPFLLDSCPIDMVCDLLFLQPQCYCLL